jgi:hypothetical protein
MAINIFGWELGKKSMPKTIEQIQPQEQPVKSFIPPDLEDGASVVDFVGGYGFGVQLVNYDIAYRSDSELIIRYRQMSEHAEVQTAIDDIVNQSIVLNDREDPVSVNLDKSKISESTKKKIREEFEEIMRLLKFATKGNDLFKRWYIDGRLYIQILLDEKKQKRGIVDLRVIDPMRIRKVRNIEREVSESGIKFIKNIKEYYLYTSEDYLGNGKDTINFTYSSEGIIIPTDSIAYVHSGFIDNSTRKVLGYLHKAIKPLNQLRMLEDAVVIYRISRAPERRIFYIDVGSLPKNKSEQYLREIMNRYRNKMVYDANTGELRDERRHMSMLEDFWMPRREGGKGTEIQTLPGGQNLGEMQDVEYFQKKLYNALHVPPSRFKEEAGFNMGRSSEISRDEVRFTKFINRLQAKFSEVFLQILRVQLLSKNILTQEEWDGMSYDIKFDFAADSYFSELKDNEIMMTRLQLLREAEPYLGKFFSTEWAVKNILQFSEDDFSEIMEQIKEETPPPEQGGEIGPDGQPLQPGIEGEPTEGMVPPMGDEEDMGEPGATLEDMGEVEAEVDAASAEPAEPDEMAGEEGVDDLEDLLNDIEDEGDEDEDEDEDEESGTLEDAIKKIEANSTRSESFDFKGKTVLRENRVSPLGFSILKNTLNKKLMK